MRLRFQNGLNGEVTFSAKWNKPARANFIWTKWLPLNSINLRSQSEMGWVLSLIYSLSNYISNSKTTSSFKHCWKLVPELSCEMCSNCLKKYQSPSEFHFTEMDLLLLEYHFIEIRLHFSFISLKWFTCTKYGVHLEYFPPVYFMV